MRPDTTKALKKYQTKRGITVSGSLDPATFNDLLQDAAAYFNAATQTPQTQTGAAESRNAAATK
jgi:peptidoglycan hydrolase-like protein with peptidoglycan-binding domain